MAETKEKAAGGGSAAKRKGITSLPAPIPTARVSRKRAPSAPVPKRPKSVSFQIRMPPETKELAERIASDHAAYRSKLDADLYKRGLLLSLVLLGPGADGSYAGMSEQEVARQLAPLFDRQYALLDKHQLIGSYIYRVLPPGAGQLMFGIGTNAEGHAPASASTHASSHSQNEEEQAHYSLSEAAQTSIDNFAEEL